MNSTYELQEMELIEDAQNTLGLPRGTNHIPQLNSTNSITGAKLLKGVKKTNSAEFLLTNKEIEIVSAVESLSEDLNVPVRIVRNVDEIKDKDSDMQGRKRGSKGWYDPKTGKVVIVLPNATDVRDAQATMLHEIVGHKGIRGLFGDKIGEFTNRVLDSMPEAEREKWVDRYMKSRRKKHQHQSTR